MNPADSEETQAILTKYNLPAVFSKIFQAVPRESNGFQFQAHSHQRRRQRAVIIVEHKGTPADTPVF
jgi:hypothetical protein